MENSYEFGPQLPTAQEVIFKFLDVLDDKIPMNEAQETYSIWIAEKQREMDESKKHHARLIFNIRVAEVLAESQLFEDAASYCDGAWEILNNENPEIDEEIQSYLDRLNDIEDMLQ